MRFGRVGIVTQWIKYEGNKKFVLILYKNGEATDGATTNRVDIVISCMGMGDIHVKNQCLQFEDNDKIVWLLKFEQNNHRDKVLGICSDYPLFILKIDRNSTQLTNLTILPSKEADEIAKLKRRIEQLENASRKAISEVERSLNNTDV